MPASARPGLTTTLCKIAEGGRPLPSVLRKLLQHDRFAPDIGSGSSKAA